ncbi:hypothetical protein [Sorangium sp. So ce388]|uniref:hypothetical protein n=1 Tax=Sorangium sp. So ce388 TaxID=3133309 RepID=UPI003F5C49FB
MSERFTSTETSVLLPRPWTRWIDRLSIAGVIAPVVALLAGVLHLPGASMALLAAVGGWLAWRAAPWRLGTRDRVPAAIEADASGVRMGDRFLARSAITQAVLLRTGDQARVRLSTRLARDVDLVMADEADGRRLLRAMGLDVSQSVASFSVSSVETFRGGCRLLAVLLSLLVVTTMAGGILGAVLQSAVPLAAILLAMAAAITFAAWPAKLHVGADGVLLTWHWRRRFIPYSRLARASRFERVHHKGGTIVGVELALATGEVVSVPVTSGPAESTIAMIIERIRDASERSADDSVTAAALVRGSRPTSQWIAHLRAIGVGANVNHRRAPIDPAQLFRVLEDGGQPPPVRAAAALALASRGEEDTRARLRVAAEATAAPKLRVALEAAADPARDAEMQTLLEELEEEEQESARAE